MNENKKNVSLIALLLILATIIYIAIYEEELWQHYYLGVVNGHQIDKNSDYVLNNELFSVLNLGDKISVLKLRGYTVEDLPVGLVIPEDELIKIKGLLETNNLIVFQAENCIAMKLEDELWGTYKILVQHMPSKYSFLFKTKLDDEQIEIICTHAVLLK